MGIPVLSTAHGGLVEANPVRELHMPSSLVADVALRTIHRGMHIDKDMHEAPRHAAAAATAASTRPATGSECSERLSVSQLLLVAANDMSQAKEPAIAPAALSAAAAASVASGALDSFDGSDFMEGGWLGPAASDAEPVLSMRSALERLFHDPAHLQHLSNLTAERSLAYLDSRRASGGLLRALRDLLCV